MPKGIFGMMKSWTIKLKYKYVFLFWHIEKMAITPDIEITDLSNYTYLKKKEEKKENLVLG